MIFTAFRFFFFFNYFMIKFNTFSWRFSNYYIIKTTFLYFFIYFISHLLKSSINIISILSTNFKKKSIYFIRIIFSFFIFNNSFIFNIIFISYNTNNNIFWCRIINIFNPMFNFSKTFFIGYIIYNKCTICIFIKLLCYCSKSFFSCCIPNL